LTRKRHNNRIDKKEKWVNTKKQKPINQFPVSILDYEGRIRTGVAKALERDRVVEWIANDRAQTLSP
jgi:hypothetical protein